MANIFQRMHMPQKDLEKYYRERRKDRFEKCEPFHGVWWRKVIHPLLIGGLKLTHLFTGQRITVIKDERSATTRPIVFAATHIGWDDIEMIFTSLKDQATLLLGDPRETYRSLDGFLLYLNGVICIDTGFKEDRHIGKETCVRWLEKGGNLLIFPEGAWNITENLPVMGLYSGAAEMAIRTQADIIPIGIEQYGKRFRVRIGKNIDCRKWGISQKLELTSYIRDTLATLRWEIWDSVGIVKRETLPRGYPITKPDVFGSRYRVSL